MIGASEIGVKVRTMRIRYTFMKNVLLFFRGVARFSFEKNNFACILRRLIHVERGA